MIFSAECCILTMWFLLMEKMMSRESIGFRVAPFWKCGKNYAVTDINVQCKKTQSSIAPRKGQTSSRIFCRWFSNVKFSHSSEMVRLAFPGCLHWLREVVSLSLGPQHFHNARRTAGLLPRRFRRTLADGQRLALESTQKTIKSWAWEGKRIAFNILQPIYILYKYDDYDG